MWSLRLLGSLLRFVGKTIQTAFRPEVCHTRSTRSPIIGDFCGIKRKNPQVQQVASRLITLNDLIREEDEKKNMNHQRTFGSSAQRRTKEHKVPDFLVLSLFRAPSNRRFDVLCG
jgi:hypothetical protein